MTHDLKGEIRMAQTAQTNRKKIMVPTTMSKSGWAIIEARDDVEGVEFVPTIPKAEFHKVLEEASGHPAAHQRPPSRPGHPAAHQRPPSRPAILEPYSTSGAN